MARGNPLAGVVNNLRRITTLRRVLRAVQPDIALAVMLPANVLLALAVIGMRDITTIGSEYVHPSQCPMGTVWETLRAGLYGHLAAVTALTKESSAWLRQHTRSRKIAVIPNAAPFPLPEQEPCLELPNMSEERCMLLAVGRLVEGKGFGPLI